MDPTRLQALCEQSARRAPIALGALALALTVLLGACAEEDKEAPPAPFIDAVVSPTSLERQLLTGSAEYGSTVTILGGAETVQVKADDFTAAFQAQIALNPDATNTLTVTATDAAGNRSAPTTVEIIHETPRAETLSLELPDPVIDADQGVLVALARVGNDEAAVGLAGFEVTFSLGGYDDIADQTITTDDAGLAQVRFEGLKSAGAGTLTVTAGDLSRSADFVVVAGVANDLQIQLIAEDGAPADSLEDLAPGTEVTAQITILDQQDNEITPPVLLVTDAPGALIRGRTISGVVTAGEWTVAASVSGTGLSAAATMTFVPGQPAEVRLALDSDHTRAGRPVQATTGVFDAFGNEVTANAAVTLSLDPAPAIPEEAINGDTITVISPARTYTVSATLDADNTLSAQTTLQVSPADLATFTVGLDLANDDQDTPAADLTVSPDTDVNVTVTLTDGFGNPIDAPISVAADTGVLLNGVLREATRAGRFRVVASLIGTQNTAAATLEVIPGPPAAATLSVEPRTTQAGRPAQASASAFDAFGNLIPEATFTLSLDEPLEAPQNPINNGAITVLRPARAYTVRATLDGADDIDATAPLIVTPADLATFLVGLDVADDDQDTPADELTVTPDTDVNVTVTANDGFGNPVNTPISVSTDTGGLLLDGVLTGATRAGSFRVVASVIGTQNTATADLEIIPGAPTAATVTLDADTRRAGEPVTVRATAQDAFGNPVPEATFTLSLDEPVASPQAPIDGDTITIEAPAQDYTVRATLDDQQGVEATASLRITPSTPSRDNFTFVLGQNNIQAGDDVPFVYTVADAFGNPTPGVVVDVSVNSPGALVANNNRDGGVLASLTRAGLFNVAAQVRGTDLLIQEPLTVLPGAPASIDLQLSTVTALIGDPVEVAFFITDAFGNPTESPEITLTCGDPNATCPSPAQTGDEIVFSAEGNFRVTATETVSGDTASRFVTISQRRDFTPPTVTIDSPQDGTEFFPGAPVIVTISASDAGGLLELGITTRGLFERTETILLPPGTLDARETFTFNIPTDRFGGVAFTAFARDQSGNEANSFPVTIFSQFPAVNDITCDTCDAILTVAADFREAGAFPNGQEGGIREPMELAIGAAGEIYVGLFNNIRLQADNGFIGTQEIDQYISLILPDGTVEPFAPFERNDFIDDFEVIGVAYDPAERTLYASLGQRADGNNFTRIVAFTPRGIIDPFVNVTGDRDLGLAFIGGRLFVVDDEPNPDRVYVVDPDRTVRTVVNDMGDNILFDVCGTEDTLFITREDELHACDLTIGDPTTCTNRRRISNDGDLQASNGELRSCAVAPSGRVFVANRDAGTIVAVDPDNDNQGNNATVIVRGLDAPIGVEFDPATGDMLVSDNGLDAVFRFTGDF